MKTLIIAVTLAAAAFSSGCSSNTTPDPVPSTGPTDKTGTPPTDPTTGAPADTTSGGTTPAPAAVTPTAPTIDHIMKMQGALHVTWTNPTPACDTVEGERQATMADGSIMEKYKVVFTVPGEADNKHDTTATDAMTYSYRLRCKVGTAYSPYSNVMAGNPK